MDLFNKKKVNDLKTDLSTANSTIENQKKEIEQYKSSKNTDHKKYG